MKKEGANSEFRKEQRFTETRKERKDTNFPENNKPRT